MDEEKLLKLVAQAVPMPEDSRIPFLIQNGVSEDQMNSAIEMIQDVIDYDNDQNDNIALNEPFDAEDRLESDADNELEEQAQSMADDDNTNVEIIEEDADGDGDTDSKTVEKEEPKDDSEYEEDNSSEAEDKPHDGDISSDVRLKNIDNSTNSIARHLASYRW